MNTSDKDNITILQAVFNKYDAGKSGYLTIDEFTQLLLGLSKYVRELKGIESLKANAVFSLLDKDVDGKLSFVEFQLNIYIYQDCYLSNILNLSSFNKLIC